jgi:hypothetical protein
MSRVDTIAHTDKYTGAGEHTCIRLSFRRGFRFPNEAIQLAFGV